MIFFCFVCVFKCVLSLCKEVYTMDMINILSDTVFLLVRNLYSTATLSYRVKQSNNPVELTVIVPLGFTLIVIPPPSFQA